MAAKKLAGEDDDAQVEMVLGLSLGAQPKLVDGGASWLLKLATLMAQAYVELAHLVASTQKKDLYTSNLSKKSHILI